MKDPNYYGAKTAYENGWVSPYDAIVGGAAFIDDGYLSGNNRYKVVQNTLYEMRWNPEVMDTKRKADHQYATDMGWAYKQVMLCMMYIKSSRMKYIWKYQYINKRIKRYVVILYQYIYNTSGINLLIEPNIFYHV